MDTLYIFQGTFSEKEKKSIDFLHQFFIWSCDPDDSLITDVIVKVCISVILLMASGTWPQVKCQSINQSVIDLLCFAEDIS